MSKGHCDKRVRLALQTLPFSCRVSSLGPSCFIFALLWCTHVSLGFVDVPHLRNIFRALRKHQVKTARKETALAIRTQPGDSFHYDVRLQWRFIYIRHRGKKLNL